VDLKIVVENSIMMVGVRSVADGVFLLCLLYWVDSSISLLFLPITYERFIH